MTIEYWTLDEYDCQPHLMRSDTQHLHCRTEAEVIRAWNERVVPIAALAAAHPGNGSVVGGGSLLGAPTNCRYVCLRGPGGLVRRITS